VAQLLASFKVPRRIYFVDQIPRGELGKPQRWLLTENLSARHVSPALPAELTERRLFFKLHEIWMRILECDDLGFDEDFFEAGGDSLAAINMLVEVDEHFGSLTSASAASFLDEPTLAHLTDLVRTTLNVKPSQSASSEIRVFPIREGSFSQQLFCIPADTDEGLYFRRLATRLYDDEMELSIVRPANTLHGPELFTIEHAGAATAALIRQVQAEGPYFVAGYCYGGIVAVEAARQLILEGQDVRLILFDVPMPGYPSLFFDWPALIEGVRHKWRMEGNGDCPEMATNSRSFARRLAWLSGILHLFARRLVWSAVVPVRSLLAPIENITAVQRLLEWPQVDYFPFYRARPIDAPILHFICTGTVSRFGWRTMARRGIDERLVALDHKNVFHESNLPMIVKAIREWKSTFGPQTDEADLSRSGTVSKGKD